MFGREIGIISFKDTSFWAVTLCFLSVISASLGTIMASRLNELHINVVESNTLGMLYGAGSVLLLSLITGRAITMDWSPAYLLSLSYLVVLGSVVAFAAYIRTVVRIGPDRAAYALITIPVISMLISSWFENYQWTLTAFAGLTLILLGNIIVLKIK